MRPDTVFDGDDLRRTDPKFLEQRFAQYLAAVERLDWFAWQRFGKRVIHLAVRWMLEGSSTRKAARASVAAEGATDVRYDYPARTSDDTIVVRLRTGSVAVGHTVQIDAPTGWTSGRVDVTAGVRDSGDDARSYRQGGTP
jgi:hypothetical protein